MESPNPPLRRTNCVFDPRNGEAAKKSARLPLRPIFRCHSSVETTMNTFCPFCVMVCGPCDWARSRSSLNPALASATVHVLADIGIFSKKVTMAPRRVSSSGRRGRAERPRRASRPYSWPKRAATGNKGPATGECRWQPQLRRRASRRCAVGRDSPPSCSRRVFHAEHAGVVVIGEEFGEARPADHGVERLLRHVGRHMILELIDEA